MHESFPPRLLAVSHGTASAAGSRTTADLVAAVAAARPAVAVDLCFLDVASPRLPEALAGRTDATAIVPMLLSTGYHVQSDIPAAVADLPHVAVGRHLGPHPLLIDALVDRLPDVPDVAATVLVGAGSSRPEAAAELAATADLLAQRLGRPVRPLTVGSTLRASLAALDRPVVAATYLLAEGQFAAGLRTALEGIGTAGEPLGVHPSLVDLIWTRFDEACATVR